jgi:hypothetical protein
MGAATAYYLAQLGVAATVVEREAVAAAASGAHCCCTSMLPTCKRMSEQLVCGWQAVCSCDLVLALTSTLIPPDSSNEPAAGKTSATARCLG